MDEQSPLLPTHCYNAQLKDLDPRRGRAPQIWLCHCLRATRSSCQIIYKLIKEDIRGIIEGSCRLKELIKCYPQTFLCLLISCTQICVTLLFTNLEGVLPGGSLVRAYLLINSVLEGAGKLA